MLHDLLVQIASGVTFGLLVLLLQRVFAGHCFVFVMGSGTSIGQRFLGLRVLHLIIIFIQNSNENKLTTLTLTPTFPYFFTQ